MNPQNEPNQSNDNANWTYTSGTLAEQGTVPQPESTPQSTALTDASGPLAQWSASEFISHEKSPRWYMLLAGASLLLGIVIYFITRQNISVVVVIVMGVLFAVYGSAKPRTVTYELTGTGIAIGNKFYPFLTLKSFSVINEGGMPYIQLLLQKRLSVPLTIYTAPEQIDTIANILGEFIPYDQKKRDIADKFSSKIHF